MRQGPLSDTMVIDLTRVLSGPYCTMMLADLGARVIKVERRGLGDDARAIGPFSGDSSMYFASINRGKESIDLDLKDTDDRKVFEALLERADILVENFRPGTMDRLGYGWAALEQRWPKLVFVSISGFGQTGPLSDRPAYDMVVQAMGGLMSITGEPDGSPTRVGTSIGDIAAGMFGAFGAVAALHQRARTGSGARVDVAMLDGQVALLENAIARYVTTGKVPGPIGSRHPSISPFGVFRARNGPLVLAAGNDSLFAQLCATLGIPEVSREVRFRTNEDRCIREPELRVELEAALATDDVESWLARLERAGLPSAPVNDVAAVIAHPQVRARNMVLPIEGPGFEGMCVAGNPVKISSQEDNRSVAPPPRLGQDREKILEEVGLGP